MSLRSLLVLAIALACPDLRAATVVFYQFDEGPPDQPASTVVDSGPNAIHGTALQTGTAALPIYREVLPTGLQLEFSGNGEGLPSAASYIQVVDPGASPLDLTGPLTVEAVIRPALIDQQVIVRKLGGLAGSGYYLDLDSTGHVSFRLQDDLTRAVSALALQLNNTYHVAGTWDGSTIRVYVNYNLEGQFAYNGPLNANNDKLGIGAILRNNGTVGDGFAGLMDSVRISNVALSPQDFLPIPEPSTSCLSMMGALGLIALRQKSTVRPSFRRRR